MLDGLCNSASQGKGQKFNNVKVSLCHSAFGESQDRRYVREKNWKKHLMVLNHGYTRTRGKSSHCY